MATGKPLAGKRAVVTGATRGIGQAVAQRLQADGADVMVTGTQPGGSAPAGCIYETADFREPMGIDRFAKVLKDFAPDVLVNNAGINRLDDFERIAADDFAAIQQVNVTAPFRLSQASLPAMRDRRWGRIVNVASVWGKVGKERRASYSTSKFALVGMSAALAAEVARDGILVNCVSPGPIETEMTRRNLTGEMLAHLLESVPAGRLGRPEEVAALVAWLAGPENTFVTGQNIAIDGGMLRV